MKNLFIALALLVGCISCNNGSNNNRTNKSTTLKLNWIYTGSFAPEALSAKEFVSKNNLTLKLEPGGQGKDPLKLVGDNEFGAAAADEILRANDKGGQFVIIGVINYNSPACFLSLAKDNIKTPKDFEGKTIGILPFGSTGLVYKILLKKAGVGASKVKELTVYPDLKVFLSGKTHQVQPSFIFDETVSLDLEGINYNVVEPKDYGVVFKGPCYFTTLTTIQKNPELVQAFINSMAGGMNEAINSPEKAIKALKEVAPDINEARELKVWQKGIPYYKGFNNQPLTSDTASWQEMIAELRSFGELKNEPDLSTVLNFSFINKFYNK
jgi:NitT/TauT family transport system substrate-binding protein